MVLLLSPPLHWRMLLLNSSLCNLNILLVPTYQFAQRGVRISDATAEILELLSLRARFPNQVKRLNSSSIAFFIRIYHEVFLPSGKTTQAVIF